jgi:hypothetical protein
MRLIEKAKNKIFIIMRKSHEESLYKLIPILSDRKANGMVFARRKVKGKKMCQTPWVSEKNIEKDGFEKIKEIIQKK